MLQKTVWTCCFPETDRKVYILKLIFPHLYSTILSWHLVTSLQLSYNNVALFSMKMFIQGSVHPGLGMQLDSEIELPFTGATVGDDSTLQYTLNFPGCNLSPPHCPLSPNIASLEVHFRIIITRPPTAIWRGTHALVWIFNGPWLKHILDFI